MKSSRVYDTCLLSTITKKKIEKNTDLKYSVILSNSSKHGIVPQNIQFDKNIANEENIDRYYVVKIGDFIYNPRISTTAPCGPINQNDCCDGVVSPLYTVFSCKTERVYDKYLKYYFQTSMWHEYIRSVANTGARHDRMNVSDKDFFSMLIKLPPIAEQRKIVEILSAQDRIIELKTKLLEEKKRLKKYLCQVLLSGKRRFSSFSDKWKQNPLSDFLTESRLRGSNGMTAKKLTVKLWGKGVTEKKETLSGSENTAYFRRTKGQFIYSKLDFLNGAFGIIPDELDGYESTIDLPAFDVHHINTEFLLLCVSDAAFYKRNGAIANGGRKAKRINPNDFLSFCINHPSLSEQTSIVDVFRRVDEVITLCENEIKQEQFKKKALMQQLLTGKIRVKV